MSDAKSPRPAPTSTATWVAATIMLCGAIFAIQIGLHQSRVHAARNSYDFVNSIGHARTDFYLGYLHLSLAGSASSPWQRDQGRALLAQALDEFRHTQALVPAMVAAKGDLEEQLGKFSLALSELENLTQDPSNGLRLRTALFELDEAVTRFESGARTEIQRNNAQMDSYLDWAVALSLALLVTVSFGTIWVARRQAAAIGHLEASEERFRRLFQDAPTPKILTDRSGERMTLNTAFQQVFGYTAEDIPRLDDWRRLAYPNPEYRANVQEDFQTYLRQPDPQVRNAGKEINVTCKDGTERVAIASGIVLRNGDILATFTDVTERNRARDQLIEESVRLRAARAEAQESKAKLEAALASMSDAVFISDASGHFIHLNAAFATFHRFHSMDECDRTFAAYPNLLEGSFPDGNPAPVEMWAMPRALRGETAVEQEYHLRRKDTGESWIGSYNFAPIRDPEGRIVGSVVSARDVTERKQAERELFESRERLHLMIEHAPVAMALFDREMRYLAVSRRWQTDYRLGDTNPTGRSHYEVFPELPERWREAHRRGLAGEIVKKEEEAFQHADGSVRWLHWEVLPWFGSTGDVGGILLLTEDITERKNAEAEIRESQQRLARAQKMEAIGQLTGGIAHDFNNILAVIMGNTELLRASLADRPDGLEMAERALRATRRGADLTRRLLAYARKQDLNPALIDVNAQVRSIVDLLARTLGKNIEIETRLSPDVDGAVVDPGELENAILNLAINARDAMPNGGKLLISTAKVEIAAEEAGVYGLEPGAYETIVVGDTGSGMTPEVLARAFDPFFTTKPTGKGTGLGLSMVYGFARQSGGHITAYSEPGHGTTIRLYLPCPSTATPQPAAALERPTSKRGAGERILVVEDGADVRQLVINQLESLNYSVHAVDSSAAALAWLRGGAPIDLMLSDVMLAGEMNGVDLGEAAQAARPGLPILYMSGYAEGGKARERIRAAGGVLLEKPFAIHQLSEAVATALAAVRPMQ